MIYIVLSNDGKKVEHVTPVWEEARLRARSLAPLLGVIIVISRRETEGGIICRVDHFVPDNLL